jgi:hypothetical protein
VSCADDRPVAEQLALWPNWGPEPPGVEPAEQAPPVAVIGPHMLRRGAWVPIDTLPDLATYQPAA